jgi:ADP-ribose pyrophosphatase YjhB (NUDIX family)
VTTDADGAVVITVVDPELARVLGADFRWPVVSDAAHAVVLVDQGFSCVVVGDVEDLPGCRLITVPDGVDVGGAHQHVAAQPGLDPLRLNADVGVFAWVTDDEHRLLLVRAAYGYGTWGLPGGTIGLYEALDQAVAREVREETGYEVGVDRVVALYGRRQHIGVYFACSLQGGEARTDFDTEVAEVGWFDPAEPPPRTSPVIPLLLADLASGEAAARFF